MRDAFVSTVGPRGEVVLYKARLRALGLGLGSLLFLLLGSWIGLEPLLIIGAIGVLIAIAVGVVSLAILVLPRTTEVTTATTMEQDHSEPHPAGSEEPDRHSDDAR